MAERRRSLTAGLSVVPPGAADAEAVKSFITQDQRAKTDAKEKQEPPPLEEAELPSPEPVVESAPTTDDSAAARNQNGQKSAMRVGLIPVTVRLKPEIASALKRASLERQLAAEDVYTQQDLVELALEPWLKGEGYLP